jgi:MFS transporter, DHA1 family, tetracycline resistance protein
VIGFIRKQLRTTFGVLSGFKGNAKACILVEPLWGIPFNLYSTYASVYMLALGCSKIQIGLISSIGLALQTVFSLVSGYVTDRLGRRRTSLIFDLVSWSIPTLLWAFAQNFWFFLAAGAINSLVRIVANSWTCLMIEDTPARERVHIFTWISVAGILAGFFAPIAGILVDRFQMVTTMRGLYLFAFASMTFMFFLRNALTVETGMGLKKLQESRHADFRQTREEYGRIARHLLSNPVTIAAFLINILININVIMRGTFLSILLTKTLGFPDGAIAIFPFIHAGIMLFVFVFVMPSIGRMGIARPLFAGVALLALSAVLLILAPPLSWAAVIASTVLGSVGTALAIPISDTFVANAVSEKDRAKAMSLFYASFFALTAPFGYLGGLLSAVSDRLPFLIAAGAVLAAACLAAAIPALEKKGQI